MILIRKKTYAQLRKRPILIAPTMTLTPSVDYSINFAVKGTPVDNMLRICGVIKKQLNKTLPTWGGMK